MTKHETPDTHPAGLIPQNEELFMRTQNVHSLDFLTRTVTRELGEELLVSLAPLYGGLLAKDVRPLNFRLGAGAGVVLASAPRMGDVWAEIVAATSYGEARLRELHDLALASAFAATDWQNRFGAGGAEESARTALLDEGRALRLTFSKQARTFGAWDLLTPAEVASVPKGSRRIKTLADDLGAAVGLFERKKQALEPKAQIPWSTVERGQKLAMELHRLLSDGGATAEDEATDRCRRLGNLLVKRYEVARRAVAYTRVEEGDAELIVPSILGVTRRPARRSKAADAAKVKPGAAGAASPDPKAEAGGVRVSGGGDAPANGAGSPKVDGGSAETARHGQAGAGNAHAVVG